MNEVIKLAIEKGGYKHPRFSLKNWRIEQLEDGGYSLVWDTMPGSYRGMPLAVLFMSKDFWQALGKALGWKENILSYYQPLGNMDSTSILVAEAHKAAKLYAGFYTSWQWMWHRFIDWIAKGKDVDEFFKELIK